MSRSLQRSVDLLVSSLLSSAPPSASHLTAFSGGVDSSLALKLVSLAFPAASRAVIGVSAALPSAQLRLAREVARAIGAPLTEVRTAEGANPEYVRNRGQSCFHCKTALYESLSAVLDFAGGGGGADAQGPLVLYNGTNADDLADPTRVGLLAARDFQVVQPLAGLAKPEVRELAAFLGLPNHAHAASPCLRSRLAFGVEATAGHMRAIERAEGFVREGLGLPVTANMRVRMLAGGRAVVELDYGGGEEGYEGWVGERRGRLRERGGDDVFLKECGFVEYGVRRFKSGGEAVEIKLSGDEVRRIQRP
ncbi:hypothetical protein TeGR_g3978 [Tetraparma gracilis]|uniref:Asparagine synthetase domain-containing protein n=1 Tax=Tetraparma gracilis TaxID=2962635 RepID=A0ABQ6MTK0_9STRA|nr:hypothetical protein TeGR_g3978 [Tetraparma gracilis]